MRSRIVEEAADQIFLSGARMMNLDRVREQVGASKSQIYHYFSSKDDLIAAVLDFQSERVINGQMPELDAIESVDTLRRWCTKIVATADTYGTIGGCPLGSLANECAGEGGVLAGALALHLENWRKKIEQGLIQMRDSGALSLAFDPQALSQLFLAAIQGGLLWAKTFKSTEMLRVSLNQLVDQIEAAAT
ncbi:MAG TPA: TetR/AcrR family transcriptional regulator [Asticcacaulis sp.]|nr:TetR/AcrR family transcriptional regulator [Asticcacaulis sp.]